ncbi:hypothetical protein psal_cds_305 [Pandoravirus salinus]|uniref:Uncharacterized protein n=1 Tax=Pandoravirus salinus TaxID=1349410 RepID=S4VTT9_9VIRU|nr:hypothetical protein psal_cds_305 [Pandoravirus salinus]AGO83909.1 hypothetical protein psal_cds_305 [Pandoravirus salinus]
MGDSRRASRCYEPVTPPGSSPDTPILVDALLPPPPPPLFPVGTKRRRQPPSDSSEHRAAGARAPSTSDGGAAVTYSPVLPHGFAVRLSSGAVDAGIAARAAFSLACLRSTGPVCRNVVGPLVHTLGRYFAGGGRVTVAGRTGRTAEYRSVEALVATRRTAFTSDDARAAARRWLAACALAQVSRARWHPRRFTPSDAVLDAVYAHLAEAAAPGDLLRAAPIEMHAWLQRSGDLRARLSWALLHATTAASASRAVGAMATPRERVDAGRLALALDTLGRQPSLLAAAPLALLDAAAEEEPPSLCDGVSNPCGCPSARLCTAWGPERSVGAWQRSAVETVAFVVATPARAIRGPPLAPVARAPKPLAPAPIVISIDDDDGDCMAPTSPLGAAAEGAAAAPRQQDTHAIAGAATSDTTEIASPVDNACDERRPRKKRTRSASPHVATAAGSLPLRPDDTHKDKCDCPPLCDDATSTPPTHCAAREVDQDESFWQWLDEQFPCEPLPFLSSSPSSLW